MGEQQEAQYTGILRPGGWFEIREEGSVGRWVATDTPVSVRR